jgi:phage portal protein BeeE
VIHVAYRYSNDGAENGGVLGVSPIMQNKETVALMIAAERFAALFFANGAQPSMILEYDKELPNDEVAQRLVETLKLGAEMACTMYRTPPHKIGLLERATNNNIEHQSIDYVTGSLSAMAKAIESATAIASLHDRPAMGLAVGQHDPAARERERDLTGLTDRQSAAETVVHGNRRAGARSLAPSTARRCAASTAVREIATIRGFCARFFGQKELGPSAQLVPEWRMPRRQSDSPALPTRW